MVPKYSITQMAQANRLSTGSDLVRQKSVKEGTGRHLSGTEHAPGKNSPASNIGGITVQSNRHVTQKSEVSPYQPAQK